MRLTDIAMSVDIRFYLRQWEGAYQLEWQGGDAVVVRFEREQDLKGDQESSCLGCQPASLLADSPSLAWPHVCLLCHPLPAVTTPAQKAWLWIIPACSV
jgi:hypothetical protein